MLDIAAPRTLEILISKDGTKLWVNTEEGCVLRACKITVLYLHDGRKVERIENEKK